MPSRVNTHPVDPLLSNWGYGFAQDLASFIAADVAPVVRVEERSGYYPIWGAEAWRVVDSKIGDTGLPKRVDWEYSKGAYLCESHALAAEVSPLQNGESPFDMYRDAVELISRQLMLERESAVITAVTDTATITELSSTVAWSASTATIVSDVDAAKLAILKDTGKDPDSIVMGIDVFNALRIASEMKNYIQYSTGGVVTRELLAAAFGVENVYISRSVYDSAQKGATRSGATLWPAGHALVFTKPTGSAGVPAFARTFFWNGIGRGGIEVNRWRDEERGPSSGVDVIKVGWSYDVVVQQAGAARVLDVL